MLLWEGQGDRYAPNRGCGSLAFDPMEVSCDDDDL